MNPVDLRSRSDADELAGQAWDLMQIEAMAENIAADVAKNQAKK